MNDKLDLRLKAFRRSLDTLDLEEHKAIWLDRKPLIFTTLRTEAGQMVAALEEAGKKHQADSAGATAEKEQEETELEDAAFALAQALRVWFSRTRQTTEAVEMTLSISAWRELRDQHLLQRSQRVIDLAAAVIAGPDAAGAEDYGITPDAVAVVTKERKDYDDIVNAPGVVIAVRKALTKGFPRAFGLVDDKFGELDSLIVQFAATESGRGMIAAWKDARLQKGQRSSGFKSRSEEQSEADSGPGSSPLAGAPTPA